MTAPASTPTPPAPVVAQGPAPFTWRTESDTPAPTKLSSVGDALKADEALRRVRKGEFLLYQGDFHNARQLLGAMARRLPVARHAANSLSAFRAARRARAIEHDTLGRVVVELDAAYNGPQAGSRRAWLSSGLGSGRRGPHPGFPQDALGLMLARAPKASRYLAIRLTHRRLPTPTAGLASRGGSQAGCFDIGTGTGVLALLLLKGRPERGNGLEPRAVARGRTPGSSRSRAASPSRRGTSTPTAVPTWWSATRPGCPSPPRIVWTGRCLTRTARCSRAFLRG